MRFFLIALKDKLPVGAGIQFLRAAVADIPHPPIALIRYAMDGREASTGLRLDLNKQAFLDHFEEGSPQEDVLTEALPQLLQLVYEKLNRYQGAKRERGDYLGHTNFRFADDSPVAENPQDA